MKILLSNNAQSWLGLVAVAGLLVMLAQTSRSAYAASPGESGAVIVVNTTDDELNADGDCSLREAIQAANTDSAVDRCPAGSGDDEIQVPAGTYVLALGAAGDDTNAGGDLDITGNLNLFGDGASNSDIDGNQLDRVLHIHSGVTAEIVHLTIANGRAPDGEESGCGAAGDEACSGGRGGGVLNQGTLQIRDSIVISNASGDGGGSPWENEDASGADGGYGGGIYNEGILVLESTVIRGNRSGTGGTAFVCASSGGYGGGVANVGSLRLIDTIIEANTTGRGGSCYGDPTSPFGPSGDGGGLFSSGTLSITASEIRINTTGSTGSYSSVRGGRGGGVANSGTFTLTTSTVVGNATGDGGETGFIHGGGYDAGDGGGIHNAGSLTIHGSTVSDNVTGSGGDGSCRGPGDGGDGGGIANTGVLVLHNSTVSDNQTGDGGEAWCDGPQYGQGGDGGGIVNTGTADVNHTTIAANSAGASNGGADGQGGGIANHSGAMRIKNSIVASNRSAGDSPDCNGAITSFGFNLIGESDGCTIEATGTGDLLDQDALLAPLANYGGPTWTLALYTRSPAIDAGSCTDIEDRLVTTDQRGAVRPYACAPNLLTNGGFEQDHVGWYTATTGTDYKAHELIGTASDGFQTYNGRYAARLGGWEGVWDVITQTVTIPAQGQLSFWWRGTTYETLPGHDNFAVALLHTDGSEFATLAYHDDQDVKGTWRQDLVDVSAYALQELVLRFSSSNDNYFFTTFFLDEICLYRSDAEAKCDIGAYEAGADLLYYVNLPTIQN